MLRVGNGSPPQPLKYVYFLIASPGQSTRLSARIRSDCGADPRVAAGLWAEKQPMQVVSSICEYCSSKKDTGFISRTLIHGAAPALTRGFCKLDRGDRFCAVNKLSDIQLVLKFDEQKYDIVLPVLPPATFSNNRQE